MISDMLVLMVIKIIIQLYFIIIDAMFVLQIGQIAVFVVPIKVDLNISQQTVSIFQEM